MQLNINSNRVSLRAFHERMQYKRKIALLPRQVEQECSQGKKSGGRENQDYGYSYKSGALTVKAAR